jgi:hypothetical protein
MAKTVLIHVQRFSPPPRKDPYEAQRKLKEPSLFKKAKNLASAGAQVVAHKVTQGGPILVPDEVKADRINKCQTCPGNHWLPLGNLGLGKCRLCGCCALKHELAALECPIGVWPKYSP